MTLVPVHMGQLFNIAHAQCLAVVFSKHFYILVWMGEDNVKTVYSVDIKNLCYVFSEMKTEVFEKVLVWTWPYVIFPV